MISVAFAIGSVFDVAAGLFKFHQYSKRKSEVGKWHSIFFYPLRINENDIMVGMNEKTALGSNGPFGRTHFLDLPSGEKIAIKKLVNFRNQSSKSLKNEVKTLAKIRHKNIAKVLGFCHSDESLFLIYEFLSKGSLGELICRHDFEMSWSVRLRIAIGVARGLAYLHRDYTPRLLHRNLKSNNILLDADLEPKIADFALDRIVGEAAFSSTIASECAHSCYISMDFYTLFLNSCFVGAESKNYESSFRSEPVNRRLQFSFTQCERKSTFFVVLLFHFQISNQVKEEEHVPQILKRKSFLKNYFSLSNIKRENALSLDQNKRMIGVGR